MQNRMPCAPNGEDSRAGPATIENAGVVREKLVPCAAAGAGGVSRAANRTNATMSVIAPMAPERRSFRADRSLQANCASPRPTQLRRRFHGRMREAQGAPVDMHAVVRGPRLWCCFYRRCCPAWPKALVLVMSAMLFRLARGSGCGVFGNASS